MEERGKNRGDGKTRYKQLQDDLKEKRGYWQLKEEALDRTFFENWLRELPQTRRKTECGMTEPPFHNSANVTTFQISKGRYLMFF